MWGGFEAKKDGKLLSLSIILVALAGGVGMYFSNWPYIFLCISGCYAGGCRN